MTTVEPQTQLYTVRQFARHHEWISEGGLRWLLFRRDANGLQASGAIIRMGRKILIDEQEFLRWLRHRGRE